MARLQAFAKSSIWHMELQKDRGTAVVCSTNVEEHVFIDKVPGQRAQARVLKLDGDHHGWHVGSTAGNSFLKDTFAIGPYSP